MTSYQQKIPESSVESCPKTGFVNFTWFCVRNHWQSTQGTSGPCSRLHTCFVFENLVSAEPTPKKTVCHHYHWRHICQHSFRIWSIHESGHVFINRDDHFSSSSPIVKDCIIVWYLYACSNGDKSQIEQIESVASPTLLQESWTRMLCSICVFVYLYFLLLL